ncbi:MAG TPA: SGNH/GDSL hydrolase family protein [Solirubrobacteraceae bacterium]|nr:SGNH/GDSL hydrolase family protein [Solirubrobacteraceae bacterium]
MAVRFRSHVLPAGCLLALAAVFSLLLFAPGAGARGHHAPGWQHPAGQGGGPRSPFPPKHPHPPQQTYLALGDSLAFGYSEARFKEHEGNENPAYFETGYVDDFGDVLKIFEPGLQIVNDGCPGETTESLIKGPCLYQLAYPLHHPYAAGPASAQLTDALSYLHEHPGAVNPITIDIGANDALGLIETICKRELACILAGVPALFAHVGANLGLILGDLRAAAPQAQIIVLGLYNPFGETLPGGDELTAKLNEVMAGDAAAVGARFADPLPVFNPPGALEAPTICLLTNMCTPLQDIHPTDLGYAVLAGLILHQYILGLPAVQRGPWTGVQVG